jgi:hypothetical protein
MLSRRQRVRSADLEIGRWSQVLAIHKNTRPSGIDLGFQVRISWIADECAACQQ